MNPRIMSWIGYKTIAKIVGGGMAFACLAYPQETALAAAGVAVAGTVGAGYWALGFKHRRNWIRPLHATLCGPLGIEQGVRPTSYIKIPRNYPTREHVGRINLPVQFIGSDTSIPSHVIKTKLALTEVTVQYKLAGRHPHLLIRQTPRPPGKCTWSEYQMQASAAAESAPLLGIGSQSRQVSVDLDAESPHILVSASTGGGKSVITRAIASQMLHNGAQLVVLDFKRHSHRWAQRLPQAEYCREISDIHETLVALGLEGHRRNRLVDDWDGNGELPVGPRLVIVVEEANATMSKLKRHWTAIRTPQDPKESPAIDALRETLFMGRAVRMHVVLVAQSATASALGGPEVRENFATRILARYTQNAWRMLVPEVSPIPRSTRHIGRAQVVLGGVATETQILYLSDTEATEWAMSGTVAPPLDLSRDMTTFSLVGDVPDASRDVTPVLTLVKGDTRITLAEASRTGVVPMSADALRQAKRRDPEFPAGVDGRWTAVELADWYRNRARSA